MSGFIDSNESNDVRLERLELLVLELLQQVNVDTLTTDAQLLLWSLEATKEVRNRNVRDRLFRLAGIDPDARADGRTS